MNATWLRPARHAPYVLIAYASRALAAFIIAAPFAAAMSAALGEWPDGSALLGEPGGLMLLEAVRQQATALRMAVTQGVLLVSLMIPVSAIVTTMLLVSVSERERVRLPEAMGRAAGHLGAMAIAYVVMSLFAGAILLLFYVLAELLSRKLSQGLGYRGGDLAYVGVLAAGVLAACAVTIVHDLVRASIVVGRADALLGIARGWRAARESWLETASAFWPRAAGAVLLVLLAILAGRRAPVAVSALVQQAAAIGLIVLRTSWLTRAVEIARRAQGVASER